MQREPEHNSVALILPCDKRYLGALAQFVEQAVLAHGFRDEDAKSAALAAEETAANAVTHAYEPGESGTVTVRLSFSPAGLVLSVQDKGIPITEKELLGRGDEQAGPDKLGMTLVEGAMDEVHLVNRGNEGKEVRMVKYASGGHIEEIAPPQAEQEPLPQELDLQIRRMNPGEEIKLSRLLYNSYGYSYPNTTLYYPERIAQLHKSGALVSFVAATADGRILGHTALMDMRQDSLSAELGAAAVDARCRGRGISEKLLELIYRQTPSMGLSGLYVEAVTSHTASQKAALKGGLRECALFMGVAISADFKRLSGKTKERETLLLLYKQLVPQTPSAVYLPPRHAPMLEKLYASVGLSPEFRQAGTDGAGPGEPVIEAEFYERHLNAAIVIKKDGPGAVEQTRRILHQLCIKRAESVLLFLDLENPLTPLTSAGLEAGGCFLAGILPGRHFRHTLVLQYLNNLAVDYGAVRLHSGLGGELLQYLRAQDPNQA